MKKMRFIETPGAIQAAKFKRHRFKVEAYFGGKLKVAGYEQPVVIDLATLKPHHRVVANLDHDMSKRVGVVDEIENDGRKLTLAGAVNAVSASATEFVKSAQNGFQWAASVEAAPGRLQEIKAGETVPVNGQNLEGPFYIAWDSVLSGIAFVSLGADSQARAMLAQSIRARAMLRAELKESGERAMARVERELRASEATQANARQSLPLIHGCGNE